MINGNRIQTALSSASFPTHKDCSFFEISHENRTVTELEKAQILAGIEEINGYIRRKNKRELNKRGDDCKNENEVGNPEGVEDFSYLSKNSILFGLSLALYLSLTRINTVFFFINVCLWNVCRLGVVPRRCKNVPVQICTQGLFCPTIYTKLQFGPKYFQLRTNSSIGCFL